MKSDAIRIPFGSPPPFESLQALLTFVDTGGVAAAAETLDLPQPTLSRRLKIFQRRDAHGETILTRQGRNLRLTEKGQAALPSIRELVRQFEQLDLFLRGARAATQVVRIGIGSFAAERYLPGALADLRRRQNRCEVQTEQVRGQERILGVAEGRFDLAVVTHDPRQIQTIVSASSNRRATLVSELLATHTICVLASNTTPFASELRSTPANRPVPLVSLSRGTFVGLDRQSGIRLQLESEFQKIGLPLRFLPETTAGGWGAAREYARHDLGAAILPLAALVPGDESAFVIRRLPERFAVRDYLLRQQTASDAPEPAIFRALRQAAKECMKEVKERWQTGA